MDLPPGRSNRRRLGQEAETRAVEWLTARGFRVLERNVYLHHGEIDFVAEDGEMLVFVEVRSRHDAERGAPEETLGPSKRATLLRTIRAYLAERGLEHRPCRVDVVALTGDRFQDVRHVENALESDDPWR
jgi:putative endonuclease